MRVVGDFQRIRKGNLHQFAGALSFVAQRFFEFLENVFPGRHINVKDIREQRRRRSPKILVFTGFPKVERSSSAQVRRQYALRESEHDAQNFVFLFGRISLSVEFDGGGKRRFALPKTSGGVRNDRELPQDGISFPRGKKIVDGQPVHDFESLLKALRQSIASERQIRVLLQRVFENFPPHIMNVRDEAHQRGASQNERERDGNDKKKTSQTF